MVRVRVAGVALDETGQHVVLLAPVDPALAGRVLPVWIGALEATSIMIAIQGETAPRPLAHDLLRAVVDTLGATVAGVEVTRIEDGTFYAEVELRTSAGTRVVDARPSDGIALASRTDAPIAVADAVFEEAAIPDPIADEVDERVAEFTRFLDDIDPDDFRG